MPPLKNLSLPKILYLPKIFLNLSLRHYYKPFHIFCLITIG